MEQPFIQLIVLPNHEYSLAELESLAEEFYRVDLLTRKYDTNYSKITNRNFHIHVDLEESTIEQMINRVIDDNSDFYLITSDSPKVKIGIAQKLRDKINRHKYVLLVKSKGLSGLLVNTKLSNSLCNFGQQPVNEKIDIWSKNNGLHEYVFEGMNDLFNREDSTSG